MKPIITSWLNRHAFGDVQPGQALLAALVLFAFLGVYYLISWVASKFKSK